MIISAGMPRSGSTLLFNMLRELLKAEHANVLVSGWEDDIPLDGELCLVKSHSLERYVGKAEKFFFSYRDIRTVYVSHLRKFPGDVTMEMMWEWIEQYKIARDVGAEMFRFEHMMRDPLHAIERCARVLNSQTNVPGVLERVQMLELPVHGYSKETLLHSNHFTNTKGDEWKTVMPRDLYAQVQQEFAWWFRECGYEL